MLKNKHLRHAFCLKILYSLIKNYGKVHFVSADQAQPAGERQLSSLSGRRFPTTDQIPSGAPNAVDAVKTRLHTQVAIYARDFGALLGMSPAETTEAIGKKRLGVPTFQLVENGIHRVSSRVVLDFFAARGIEL